MKRKFFLIFLIFLSFISYARKDFSDLKKLFDFGINIYDYDFKISSLKYADFIKILENNKNIGVQTEAIIDYIFYSKDKEKTLDKITATIGTYYLEGKKIENHDFLFTFLKFLNLYNEKEVYLSDIVDLLREFEIAEKLYKDNPWVYITEANVMYVMSKEKVMEKYNLGYFDKVENAIYLAGNNSKLHYSAGNFFKNTAIKNPSGQKLAVIEYQKAVKFSPKNKVLKTAVLKNLMTILDVYRVNSVEAPFWLKELVYLYTIDINPSDAYAYNNLAFLYARKIKKPDLALKYAKQAFELKSDDPNILDTLGYAYLVNGNFDNARKYFEKAYSLDKNNTDIIMHLVDFYILINQKELAEKFLEKYVKLKPGDYSAKNNLAYILAELNEKLDYAYELITEVVNSPEGDNYVYKDTLGWILFKKKRYSDALKVFEDIKEENDSEILRHKGYVYAKNAKYEKALKYFRKALTKEPGNDIVLKNYVVLYNLVHYGDKLRFMKDFVWE